MKPTSFSELTLTEDRQHFYWLDWLRFLAALMVVVGHARLGSWVEWRQLGGGHCIKMVFAFFCAVTRTGMEWVIVFFVLSGFLVGGKVLERVSKCTFDGSVYTIDRFSRIYLPLVPALLLTMGISFILGEHISVWEFFGNLLGLQGIWSDSFAGNIPLWSLAYEMWFYLLAGFIAVAMDSRFRVKPWAYFGMVLCLGVFTKLNVTFLFCWGLGVSTYSLTKINIGHNVFWVGCSTMFVGFVLSQLQSESISFDIHYLRQFIPSRNISLLILSLGLALVIPFISQRQPSVRWLATLERFGNRLATFSYTLYLTHYPVLQLWDHFGPEKFRSFNLESIAWFLVKIAACLCIAWLLYLPFEAQTARLRDWFKCWTKSKRVLVI